MVYEKLNLDKMYAYYGKHYCDFPVCIASYKFHNVDKKNYLAMYGSNNQIIAVLYEDGKIKTNYSQLAIRMCDICKKNQLHYNLTNCKDALNAFVDCTYLLLLKKRRSLEEALSYFEEGK